MEWWLVLITGGVVLGMLVEIVDKMLGTFAARICLVSGAVCLSIIAYTSQ